MRIFFDVDGTLCHTRKVDFDDPQGLLSACTPRPAALQELLAAHRLGHDVGILTYRGPHVAETTRAQLRSWLGAVAEDLVVEHRPSLAFDWSHYIPDKEAVLRRHGVDVYVGDRSEDRAAALHAGAAFIWDRDWEAHGLRALHLVPPWEEAA